MRPEVLHKNTTAEPHGNKIHRENGRQREGEGEVSERDMSSKRQETAGKRTECNVEGKTEAH